MPSDRMPLAELAAAVGRHPNTVSRWITVGVVVNGRRVRLAATRLGTRYEIDPGAVAEFRRLCSPVDPAPVESPAKRAKRAAAAKAEAARLLGG